MGSVYNGIPEEFALGIKKTNGLSYFIETGTCYGATSAWAASFFDKVFTIELSHELAQIAGKRLNKYSNVTLMEGLSSFAASKPCLEIHGSMRVPLHVVLIRPIGISRSLCN